MKNLTVDVSVYPDSGATISFVRGDTIPLTVEFINIIEPYDISIWDKYSLTLSKTARPKSALDTFTVEGELADVEIGQVANKVLFPLPELPNAGAYYFDIQLENTDGSNKYTPVIGSARVVQDINLE